MKNHIIANNSKLKYFFEINFTLFIFLILFYFLKIITESFCNIIGVLVFINVIHLGILFFKKIFLNIIYNDKTDTITYLQFFRKKSKTFLFSELNAKWSIKKSGKFTTMNCLNITSEIDNFIIVLSEGYGPGDVSQENLDLFFEMIKKS